MLIDVFEQRIKELTNKIPNFKKYKWHISNTGENNSYWITLDIPDTVTISICDNDIDSAMQKILKMVKIEVQSHTKHIYE